MIGLASAAVLSRFWIASVISASITKPTTPEGIVATEKQPSVLQEFKDCILRGKVVDLAVAVVIGVAFAAVVSALVRDILTPIIAAIFGKPDFASARCSILRSRDVMGANE